MQRARVPVAVPVPVPVTSGFSGSVFPASFRRMSNRWAFGCLLLLVGACGGAGTPPPTTGPVSSASAASSVGANPPAAAEVDAIVFDQYDGPKGTLRSFGGYAWTIAPIPSSGGEPCTYKQMAIVREKVIGTHQGMVAFEHQHDPKCRFAVPPSLVFDDDTATLAKGDVVLMSDDISSWMARVETTEGDDVNILMSAGSSVEMTFDAKSYFKRKVKRQLLRVVHDGLGFGGRVAVPNGERLSVETVFAATDDAVFVVTPFGTKFARNQVKVATFTKPLAVGAKIGATNTFGTLANAVVKRSMDNMIYEIETPSKKTWVVAFEDAVKLE